MRPLVLASLLAACSADMHEPSPAKEPDAHDWSAEAIYLVMPDRFANGDPTNDEAGTPGCFDPTSPEAFHGGDYAGLTAHLPYLAELGITTLWLTPPYAQAGCGYHGYWPDFRLPDDTAIEPKLGDAAALEALITAAHAQGLRVILDMVVNHAGYDASIVSAAPDYFHTSSDCDGSSTPDVTCPLFGLPDFAQEKPEVADYLSRTSRAWVDRFAIDGIRMDTARHVPLPYFRDSFLPAVRAGGKDLFVIAEVYASQHDLVRYLDAGFDSTFVFSLHGALVDSLGHGGSLDLLADAVATSLAEYGLARALLQVNPLDNHDMPTFASELPSDLDEATRAARYRLALATLVTVPGIPQLTFGDELGRSAEDPRLDMPGWAYDLTARSVPQPGTLTTPATFHDYIQNILTLRHEHTALQRGDYTELWRPNGGDNIWVFTRATDDERVVVAFNASDNVAEVTRILDAHEAVELTGSGAGASVQGAEVTFTLPAMTAGIYALD